MAENTKNLRIKLLVDTKEGAKLGASLEDAAKKAQSLSRSLEFGDGGLSNRIGKLQKFKQELISTQLISAKVAQDSINKLNAAEIHAQKIIEEKARGHNLMAQNIVKARQKTLDILMEEGRRVELLQTKYNNLSKEIQKSVSGATLGGISGATAAQDTRATSRNTSSISSTLGMRQQEKNETERLLKIEQDLLVVKQRALTLGVSASAVSANAIAQQRTAAVEITRDIGTALGMRQQETIAIRNATNALNQQAAVQQRIVDKQRAGSFSGFGASAAARSTTRPDAVVASRSLYSMGLSNVKPQETNTIKDNTNALQQNEAASTALGRTKSSLAARVIEAVSVYKLYNAVLHGTREALLAIPRAGIKQKAEQTAILGIFGTEEGTKQLQFIEDLANRAGQGLESLEAGYKRFGTSALLAGASVKEVQNTFEDFVKVSTVLHLPEERLTNLFLAIEQMYAKGVVNSEEIKKQLGNVLPGAVEVAAKAMEMSVADFMEAMRNNEIIAREAVPRIAATYREIISGQDDQIFLTVAEQLQANLERIGTQKVLISRRIFAETEELMNSVARNTANFLTIISDNVKGILQAFQVVYPIVVTNISILLAKYILSTKAVQAYTASVLAATGAQRGLAGAMAITSHVAKGLIASISGALFLNTLPAKFIALTTAMLGLSGAFGDARIKYDKFTGVSSSKLDELRKAAEGTGKGAANAAKELENLAKIAQNSNSIFIEFRDSQIELSTVFSTLGSMAREGFSAMWEEIKKASKEDIAIMVEAIVEIAQAFNLLRREAIKIMVAMWDDVKSIGSGIAAYYSELFSSFNVSNAIDAATQATKEAARGKDQRVTELVDNLFGTQEELEKRIRSNISGFGNILIGAAQQAQKSVENFVSPLGESILLRMEEAQKATNMAKLLGKKDLPALQVDAQDIIPKEKKTKTVKGNYEEIKRQYELETLAAKQGLQQIEFLYEDNLISLKDYYSKKEKLLEEDLGKQVEMFDKLRSEAVRVGDLSKIAQIDFDKEKLFLETGVASQQNNRDRLLAEREYGDLRKTILSEVLTIQGKLNEAAEIEFNIRRRGDIARANAEKDIETTKRLENLREYAKIQGDLQQIEVDRSNINDEFSQKVNLLNAQQQAGTIGQVDFMLRMTTFNEQRIAQLEEIINKEQTIQNNLPNDLINPQAIRNLERAKAELQVLKENVNEFGQFARTTFQNAFGNAFSSFVTGSMNAKEAMRSFAETVIKSLADIAAQQLSSQILGLFTKVISSTNSARFGSGYNPSTGLGNTSVNYGLANGGVTRGLSVSSTVLTKPTYFPEAKVVPFASGGVLAGEAGAEAVLPLKRGRDGKLGVSLEGNSSNTNVITINVAIDRSQNEDNAAYAARIAETIAKRVAKEEIASAARPGNINNRVTRFG